jgi:hypothetical protein
MFPYVITFRESKRARRTHVWIRFAWDYCAARRDAERVVFAAYPDAVRFDVRLHSGFYPEPAYNERVEAR